MKWIYSLGVRHIAQRDSSMSLCGLRCRLPRPERPAALCGWCRGFSKLHSKSRAATEHQTASKTFAVASVPSAIRPREYAPVVLLPRERKHVENWA